MEIVTKNADCPFRASGYDYRCTLPGGPIECGWAGMRWQRPADCKLREGPVTVRMEVSDE